MNFEIIIPLQPGEGLISHGSIQFSSSNVVIFAVGLETMNNNNNYNNNKTILAILQYCFKMLSRKTITILGEFYTLYSSSKD